MTKTTLRRAAAITLAPLALAAPAAAAPVKLTGGKTVLALDAGTAKALDSLGVNVAPVGPATAGKAGIAFPITGGKVDSETLAGKIRHSGGLTFSKPSASLSVTDFTIDTKKSVLTAVAGGQRIRLLKLDLSNPKVTKKGSAITVSGVGATLSYGAAQALNQTFGTDAFKKDLPIGAATVRAIAG